MKSASTHPIVADVSGERNLHPRVGVGGAEHEEDGVVVELGVEDAAEEREEDAKSAGEDGRRTTKIGAVSQKTIVS